MENRDPSKQADTYLSQQNLARVTATAWLDDDFRIKLETNPVPAIKERFVNTKPPIFNDFDLLGIVPERPEGVRDEELREVVNGQTIAIPDLYMPENCQPDRPVPSSYTAPGEDKIYLNPKEWCQITALAWLDSDFKNTLLKDPDKAIRERQEFKSFQFKHVLWVPPKPSPDRISEEKIQQIADGDQPAMIIPFFTFSIA